MYRYTTHIHVNAAYNKVYTALEVRCQADFRIGYLDDTMSIKMLCSGVTTVGKTWNHIYIQL